MGCYSGGTFKACGAYDKDMLTPEVCTTCCGVAGYNYSAVKFGDQCLCSNIVDANRKVDDLQCQISCKGNSVLRCGGYETYSVYEALGEYNFPCSLTMPTNISISEKFIAHFSCQPGASHNLDFGEDMILTTTNATVSYLYQSKGKYMVYGQVFLGDYGEPHSFLTSFSVSKPFLQSHLIFKFGERIFLQDVKKRCVVLNILLIKKEKYVTIRNKEPYRM